jgi:Membrane-associating domain
MVPGFIFTILRVLQILTLIPIWGLLAYFVDKYAYEPDWLLCLFVVSILATIWAIGSLLTLYRRHVPVYVAVIDLIFFGLLIAGVVLLAPRVTNTDCMGMYGNLGSGGWYWGKECSMYKAAYALGILNIIMFFITSLLAAWIWRKALVVDSRRY